MDSGTAQARTDGADLSPVKFLQMCANTVYFGNTHLSVAFAPPSPSLNDGVMVSKGREDPGLRFWKELKPGVSK